MGIDDFEASLQVLRGFDTDITTEVNEIKVIIVVLNFISNQLDPTKEKKDNSTKVYGLPFLLWSMSKALFPYLMKRLCLKVTFELLVEVCGTIKQKNHSHNFGAEAQKILVPFDGINWNM